MTELLHGLGYILVYYVICASSALLVRVTTKIPNEVFRKLLHIILLGSLWVWVSVFSRWWVAAATSIGFAVVIYPVLHLLEHIKGYSAFVTERNKGELKASLMQVFGMFAIVIAVCWGVLDDKLLVLASVYAWGFGDAAAALIGKRFGKRKFKVAGGKKSYEGTAAMFLTSFISVLTILLIRGGLGRGSILFISAVTACVSAITELFTPNGHDTVSCPLEAMTTLLLLLYAFGGL